MPLDRTLFTRLIPPKRDDPDGRVLELDALRGLASLNVVLFHYTFRFDRLFTESDSAPTSAAWEWLRNLGVPMFFIISGLVIPRTIDRAIAAAHGRGPRLRAVRAFLFGRFSRLYPTFWAAAALTLLLVGAFGLAGRHVSPAAALANLTMIPQAVGAAASLILGERVRFPYIDGVYWSLEVEWKFYALVALLVTVGLRRWLHWALAAMIVIDAMRPGGVLGDLARSIGAGPAIRALSHFTFVRDAQTLFLIGLLIHEQARARRAGLRRWWIAPLMLLCAAQVVADREPFAAAACAANAALVWTVANRRVRPLAHPALLFLGSISYALFLVHQNIGYIVIGRTLEAGWPRVTATLAALSVALALAALLTGLVERPCKRFIRARLTPPRGPAGRTAAP
ncbi:MAG: acyltransferase family protein [Phycisphaerales bacterium]